MSDAGLKGNTFLGLQSLLLTKPCSMIRSFTGTKSRNRRSRGFKGIRHTVLGRYLVLVLAPQIESVAAPREDSVNYGVHAAVSQLLIITS